MFIYQSCNGKRWQQGMVCSAPACTVSWMVVLLQCCTIRAAAMVLPMQMAAYELGQLLPEDQRPLSMDFIRINDTRSDIVPNAGVLLFLLPDSIACKAAMSPDQGFACPAVHVPACTAAAADLLQASGTHISKWLLTR